jgi:DNA-binding response OmpR family regulator
MSRAMGASMGPGRDIDLKEERVCLAPMILVVDDEEDVRLYLRTILTQEGFVVREAANAEEAMEELRKIRPDAVILDLVMPGKSGVVLFNKMRREGYLEKIPTVVLTGVHLRFIEDFGSFFRSLKLAKPIAFLEKPIDPPTLIRTLRKVLKRNLSEETDES